MLEETFNPASLNRTDTFSSSVTATKTLPGISTKNVKSGTSHPRIDFEPLYADLKVAIGHHWTVYYDALTRFIRGELSASEFGELTDHFLLATPATEHAHNVLICAILHNTLRDLPEPGPAAWVSAASDKTGSSSAAKTAITSDAGEQRLKAEIMSIPSRDRRRIKSSYGEKADEDGSTTARNPYEEYQQAGRIRAPDTAPVTAGGLKTNLELEIKKRYLQPLFSETLEFPDTQAIYARMVPLCYEESIAQGSSPQCAELVAIAAETHMKDILASVFNRTRSNGPTYENGAGDGIQTGSYRRKWQREENEFKAGKIQKIGGNSMLPIESREANARRPIGMYDLKTASIVVNGLWNGMKLIGAQVAEATLEAEQEEWLAERNSYHAAINGHLENTGDQMDMDDDDYGWAGSGSGDRPALDSLLEECLSIRA